MIDFTNYHTATFLTTYRCTAMCTECSLRCSPYDDSPILSFEQFADHLSRILKVLPSIRLVVFTGGEPFLMGHGLDKSISHCKKQNLRTRIVSNAYWAKDEEVAFARLSQLKEAGLSEINFSTGSEHQQYVSIENIINAVLAAAKLDMLALVNYETLEKDVPGKLAANEDNKIIKNNRIVEYITKNPEQKKYLFVFMGRWVPLDNSSVPYNRKSSVSKTILDRFQGCSNLFENIVIGPNGGLYSCCGLFVRDMPEFKLGNINKDDLLELLEKQKRDFLKLWLKIDGPKAILKQVISKSRNLQNCSEAIHPCQACRDLLSNPAMKEYLIENYEGTVNEVLLKLKLKERQREIVESVRSTDCIGLHQLDSANNLTKRPYIRNV